MAKKVKAKKKKVAPKKRKVAKKTKGTKKTKGKKKKVVKKKSSPKKGKKKSAPKKAKKSARRSAGKAVKKKAAPKKAKKVVKKNAVKKTKPAVKAKPVEVLDVAKAVSTPVSNNGATPFKKHVTRLKAGDAAPFFEGIDQKGNRITSLDFPGKNIVLFFYPEDDTETCTIESCNLRDEYKYLNDNNYVVIGVSPDSVDSHSRFADKYSLPYPLIADTDKTIIKAYDVWGPKQLFGRIYDGLLRTTFVIGFEGNIKSVITEVDAANHARQITSL